MKKRIDPHQWAKKHLKNIDYPIKSAGGIGGTKIRVMSNKDRRRMGIEEDETLPDYKGNK